MKTTTTFLMLALVAATMIIPSATAGAQLPGGDAVGVDIDTTCPPTTVERALCIVNGITRPVVSFVRDEAYHYAGVVITLVNEECDHLTSSCPLVIIYRVLDTPYPALS